MGGLLLAKTKLGSYSFLLKPNFTTPLDTIAKQTYL